MPYYIRRGSSFTVSDTADLVISETLPVGNYTVGFDQMREEYYLRQVDAFALPPKLYGETPQVAERILHTYHSRTQSTGALLAGEKGSGKTLLAKAVAVLGNLPALVINAPWCGDGFNRFLQQIEQPCVVLFDEFEKVYSDKDDQEQLLTLLDGVFPTRKLFVFTCNNRYKLDRNLMNRPGRIFYMLDFKGVSAQFVTEYCADHLQNPAHTESVRQVAATFGEFNFDLMQAIVEEMNRYQEDAWDASRYLNAKPESGEKATYEVTLLVRGKPAKSFYPEQLDLNPIAERVIHVTNYGQRDHTYAFTREHIKEMNVEDGSFLYQSNGAILRLQRKPDPHFDVRTLLG